MDKYFHSLSLSIRSTFSRPVEFTLPKQTINQAYKIGQRYHQVTELDKSNLEIVYAMAKQNYVKGDNEAFPLKRIKHLPWVLHHGSKSKRIIDDANFMRYILKLFEKRPVTVMSPLIYVFFLYYDKEAFGTEMLRVFLEDKIVNYQGNSSRIRRWKERAFLFSKHGIPMTLPKIRLRGQFNENFSSLGFVGTLRSGKYAEEIVKAYYTATEIPIVEKAKAIIPLFQMQGQTGVIYFPSIVSHVANSILPQVGESASQETQNIIRPFLLTNLGDPRILGNRTKWLDVSEQAKVVFRQWISRLDLEMFFNVVERVAKDSSWRYRRKFWEAYLPYAENTWVALGSSARQKLFESSLRSSAEARNYASLNGVSLDQSVFMLEMKGFIFVEWSHSGKLRVWKKGNCPLEFGRPSYTGGQIRSTCLWEESHYSSDTYRWQRIFEKWIKERCNIGPTQSYLLR